MSRIPARTEGEAYCAYCHQLMPLFKFGSQDYLETHDNASKKYPGECIGSRRNEWSYHSPRHPRRRR